MEHKIIMIFYYFFGKTKKGEGTRREAKVVGVSRTAQRWFFVLLLGAECGIKSFFSAPARSSSRRGAPLSTFV